MTWRAVAAVLELAPNAPYRYFDNRQQLETAVAAEVLPGQKPIALA
jgi:hypothetical protein